MEIKSGIEFKATTGYKWHNSTHFSEDLGESFSMLFELTSAVAILATSIIKLASILTF